MRRHVIAIVILTLSLHTNLFADIAPNPIESKSISPKEQTSIRMVSEKVVVDLYNDSSVVTCSFEMENLGEQEKVQIGFPEMTFHYYQQKSKVDEASRFLVKENGKVVQVDFPDSLKYNQEYREKVERYQIREEWYLWESEFQKGESKTIEVEYSLPFGMLRNTNERFFTYLLSTGADWNGTIGKAEIIVNLKDIEPDSLVSMTPDNYVITNDRLTWTFTDLEPTTKDDIQIYYNSNKILYTGKKPVPAVIMIDGKVEKDFKLNTMDPKDIAGFKVIKDPEEAKKYTDQVEGGVVIIYTTDLILNTINELIQSKSKEKADFSDYQQLIEGYDLFINQEKTDFWQIVDVESKSVTKVEIIDSKEGKNKIMIHQD
ncbi:MAG TPA: hypothetical protein GXZ56_00865 [Bacteroidales bacterium]|jgi:hypothetical protein|nr:hypothetical protein [Bacteroidales bacterium]